MIGAKNAKMPENACAESVIMLLTALTAFIASPAAIPSPSAAVRAVAPASVAVVADSGGSRPRIRDDVAHHSDLISPGVPR